jgi:hypothetical protein
VYIKMENKNKMKKKINASDKLAYTLMVIFSFILIGVGVYAYGGTAPATMGHSIGEIAAPAGCASGQVLTYSGSAWTCAAASATDSRFIVNGTGLCYTAPATCTLSTNTCSVSPVSVETVSQGTCQSMTAAARLSTCTVACYAQFGIACDGTTVSQCSGGTAISYRAISALCIADPNLISCTCGSGETYLQEVYHAAGIRCI